jgi:predicted dehydrogenase
LPNTQHASYATKAAKAGIHVLTEKPLAVTTSECEQMIEAARHSATKLMVAYRLHFDAATLEIADLARSGQLGDLRYFTSSFSMQVDDGNIRLRSHTAGGPLYDIGIYCINAARMVFGAEPTEVLATAATHDDPRFREVPETVAAIMRFPRSRLASFVCSFGAANRSTYEKSSVPLAASLRIRRTLTHRESATCSTAAIAVMCASSRRAISSPPSCSTFPTASSRIVSPSPLAKRVSSTSPSLKH